MVTSASDGAELSGGGVGGRIGILGGSFNPIHLGHLICAQEAAEQLGLAQVLLVPVNMPPHKSLDADPGAQHRLAMCKAAVEVDPLFAVSDIEIRRGGRSFTLETLRQLKLDQPTAELCLIIGGDMAASFADWHQPQQIIKLCHLAVAARANWGTTELARVLQPAITPDRFDIFSMPQVDASSTLIRERIKTGGYWSQYVSLPVARYIKEHALYRYQSG